MMDRKEFERLTKDALANLQDYAALEVHPLAELLPRPNKTTSRADHLRTQLVHAIEQLRPTGGELSLDAVEARPHLILLARYVEGFSPAELKMRFPLSGRQLRREQGRALQAVATLLWDQMGGQQKASQLEIEQPKPEPELEPLESFDIRLEPLHLGKVLQSMTAVVDARARNQGIDLRDELPGMLPPVLADRVVLRQVLLSMLSYVLHRHQADVLHISARVKAERVELWLRLVESLSPAATPRMGEQKSLESAQRWSQRIDATLTQRHIEEQSISETRTMELALSLPQANQPTLLVVDDQATAIRLFERYLSRSAIQVVGTQEPRQALALAQQLRPSAVALDVMMPSMDGWEVLQTLRADPETKQIPVLVCSVWDEPELAVSLGAAAFLKKPVMQRDLLAALQGLDLLPTERATGNARDHATGAEGSAGGPSPTRFELDFAA